MDTYIKYNSRVPYIQPIKLDMFVSSNTRDASFIHLLVNMKKKILINKQLTCINVDMRDWYLCWHDLNMNIDIPKYIQHYDRYKLHVKQRNRCLLTKNQFRFSCMSAHICKKLCCIQTFRELSKGTEVRKRNTARWKKDCV